MSTTQSTVGNKTNEGVACAAAEIVIDDTYITAGTTTETASVILRNIGATDDLTITSAQLYNKNGDNITASNVPISNFDRGSTSTLSFSFKPAGDSSKYGNNGTLNGTVNGVPLLTTGRYGSGLKYDGITKMVSVPGSDLFDFGSNDFTASAWVYINNVSSFQPVFDLWPDGARHIYFYHRPSDSTRGWKLEERNSSGSFDLIYQGTVTTNASIWNHVALVRNSSNLKIYLNGLQIASATFSNPLSNSTYITIGYQEDSVITFNGTIDELAFWNRSLTNAEINVSANVSVSSVSNANDLIGYWNFDGGIITCPDDFSRVLVTTNCGGVSAEFSKPPKCS